MLGVKRDGVFFSRLLSGRNAPRKYGKGLPAMKRRIHRAYALIRLAAWHAAGRDAIRADDGLLGLTGSEGSVGGAGTRTTREEAQELPGSVPVSWRLLAGGGGSPLSDKRSVMLRLGDAPAGKADAVPDFQQCLHRPSIRQGRCFGAVRLAFLHAGSVPECPVGRRPQKSPPCGGLRHSRWADRLPGLSSGGRTVMSAAGHACRTV